jgi:hypothetical protein
MANTDLWDWRGISENPNITWDIVVSNPDKRWDWSYMTSNPNITFYLNQINRVIGLNYQ